ncbi:MAG: class I SAM-dependent methyltransferase [Maricaulaceae bacterium]
MLSDVQRYLAEGFDQVEGWCGSNLFTVIEALYAEQPRDGALGPIAEIGVYQGKFFTGLSGVAAPGATRLAIDVFDMQWLNVDKAGMGDQARFEANVRAWGAEPDRLEVLRADSLSVTISEARDLAQSHGKFAFFSVDGCHTLTHTLHDFVIAQEVTANNGVIFIDDYNNPNWPEVQEAISRAFFSGAPRFVPFIFMENKLFMCSAGYHDRYIKACFHHIKTYEPSWRMKRVYRFGWECLNFMGPPGSGQLHLLGEEARGFAAEGDSDPGAQDLLAAQADAMVAEESAYEDRVAQDIGHA